MAEQDQDQKTEQPTGKRLSEAREQGQLPISREAGVWMAMLGILIVFGWVIPPMLVPLAELLRGFFEIIPNFSVDDKNLQALFTHTLGQIIIYCGLPFVLLAVATVAGTAMQTGFSFSLEKLLPDFTRLIPSQGLKKLFSARSLVELVKSFGKLFVLGALVLSVIYPVVMSSPSFTGMAFDSVLPFLHKQVLHLIEMLLLGFTIIAAGDLFYTRFDYIRNLKMTKTEVKDERRDQEGDPMIKGRLRQLRVEKARKRMMSQVPKADVVITNPTHYAVALQYDTSKMAAPIVVAKGINLIADRIREIADENRVPLVSNPPLARALYDTVEVDQQIPTQHYRAVAEVISYVYKLRKKIF